MLSWPTHPDLYCKIKTNASSITLKTGNNEKSPRLVPISDGWRGSRQWRTQQKQLPAPQVTWLITRPQRYERNTFHSFHSASEKLLLFLIWSMGLWFGALWLFMQKLRICCLKGTFWSPLTLQTYLNFYSQKPVLHWSHIGNCLLLTQQSKKWQINNIF